MKITQRGFIVPLLVLIVAILVLGGGAYIYTSNQQSAAPMVATSTTQATTAKTQSTQDAGVSMTGWSTFVNTKLGYSFQYPKSELDIAGDVLVGEDPLPLETSSSVRLSSNRSPVFSVDVPDPILDHYDGIERIMKLSVKDLAEDIWKQNKEARDPSKQGEVSAISQTKVSDTTAYQFTLMGGYQAEGNGSSFEQQQLYVFVANKGTNYTISLPANNATAQNILKTFRFTK